MVSAASIIAAVFAPAWAFWLFGVRPLVPAVLAMALLLIWRHHENIGRILRGEESRLGKP
jgi:glycerol-3-phosphate acyltransferase PlsY